jgi:hypothetical protein
MTPSKLNSFLIFAVTNGEPVLITGAPGIGKSDIVAQAAQAAGAELIISHPVVSDPTDFKGLPFPGENGKEAHFLPFGELNALITAKEPTVYFLDDLGQATPAVQAAAMQLILARRVNGFQISDRVTFIAATNRREDMAGVAGILEPVKSRFCSIIELEVNADDWVDWALKNSMPTPLIAFIRFRPELLSAFKPSRDMKNTSCPRTITAVGRLQNRGLLAELEYEVFKGAAGDAFAIEYIAFLKLYRELPNINQVILDPLHAPVSIDPATCYAISGALAAKMTEATIEPIIKYIERMPPEYGAICIKDATARDGALMNTRAYIAWATQFFNQNLS